MERHWTDRKRRRFFEETASAEYLKRKGDILMAESLHIGAEKGRYADIVLMPGDPLRAKFIAENFLEDARCYTPGAEYAGVYGNL